MTHRIMRSALYACLVYFTLVSQTGVAAGYDNNHMLMSIDKRLKEQNEGNVRVCVRACVYVGACACVRVRVGKQLLQTTIHIGFSMREPLVQK